MSIETINTEFVKMWVRVWNAPNDSIVTELPSVPRHPCPPRRSPHSIPLNTIYTSLLGLDIPTYMLDNIMWVLVAWGPNGEYMGFTKDDLTIREMPNVPQPHRYTIREFSCAGFDTVSTNYSLELMPPTKSLQVDEGIVYVIGTIVGVDGSRAPLKLPISDIFHRVCIDVDGLFDFTVFTMN